MKIISIFTTLFFVIFCATILLLSVRGLPGNPDSSVINDAKWKEDGPLELSPDRGRFALMLSMYENNSYAFSLPIARFATPDLGYINGKYVSLFAPGVSFIILPGFVLGAKMGIAQVGSFLVIGLFALLNALLLRSIALRLGAHWTAASLAALTFLFATPAFPYAVTLYQHHISTFLILMSVYLLVRWTSVWILPFVWFLCAASIPIDYPNLFLMFPIGLYALGRIIWIKSEEHGYLFNIRFAAILTMITVIVPLLFFFRFNQQSYGNPFQLSGTVAGVKAIDENGKPAAPKLSGTEDLEKFTRPEQQKKSAVNFFQSRNLLNGFYIHFFSPDRGIFIYTPVVILGVFGVTITYKRKNKYLSMILGVIAADILLYSMWGDPWGGWAFGSRYLIPAYAMMCLFLSVALTYWRKNLLFLAIFLIVCMYSISVNTLGALTSNRNPPQVEVLGLEKLSGIEQKYTYMRNTDFLNNNTSKSYVFQAFASKYMNAWQYYKLIVLALFWGVGILLISLWYISQKETQQ